MSLQRLALPVRFRHNRVRCDSSVGVSSAPVIGRSGRVGRPANFHRAIEPLCSVIASARYPSSRARTILSSGNSMRHREMKRRYANGVDVVIGHNANRTECSFSEADPSLSKVPQDYISPVTQVETGAHKAKPLRGSVSSLPRGERRWGLRRSGSPNSAICLLLEPPRGVSGRARGSQGHRFNTIARTTVPIRHRDNNRSYRAVDQPHRK